MAATLLRGMCAVVSLAVVAGCGGAPQAQAERLPPDLIVAAGARDVRISHRPGQFEVTYLVDEPFPATNLIATIDTTLRQQELEALIDDPLQPGQPSSQILGWGSLSGKGMFIHQWMADWRDADGNQTRYAFRYESLPAQDGTPLSSPDNPTIRVTAVHLAAAAATAIAQQSKKMLDASGSITSSSLSEEDAKVLSAIAVDASGGNPPEPPRGVLLVNRSRASCGTTPGDGCVDTRLVTGAKPLPGLVAAFSARNGGSRPIPPVAGISSIDAESWTHPTSSAATLDGPQLWCSLPGYSLGEAIVVCAVRWSEARAAEDAVYVLERHGIWTLKLRETVAKSSVATGRSR